VLCNRSTLEQFRAPVLAPSLREDKYAWNLGKRRNVGQVFGANPFRAVVPVGGAIGDGLHFPRSRKNVAKHEEGRNADVQVRVMATPSPSGASGMGKSFSVAVVDASAGDSVLAAGERHTFV